MLIVRHNVLRTRAQLRAAPVARRWRAEQAQLRRFSESVRGARGGGLIMLVKRSLEVWQATGAEVICFACFWRNPSLFMLMCNFCCYFDLFV